MDALWTSLTTKLAELEINLEDVKDGDWHELLTEQGFGATDRARLLNRIRRQNTRSPTPTWLTRTSCVLMSLLLAVLVLVSF